MGSSPRSFRTYSKIPSARTCIDDPDYDLVDDPDPLLLRRWVDLLEKKQTFSGLNHLFINFSISPISQSKDPFSGVSGVYWCRVWVGVIR